MGRRVTKKLAFVFTALVVVGLFAGCDKKDDEDSIAKTELQGTWERIMEYPWQTELQRIVVDGDNYTEEFYGYEDNSKSTITGKTIKYYSLRIGDETTSQGSINVGKKLDLLLKSISTSCEIQSVCDEYNKWNAYGYAGWTIGDFKDVTGKYFNEQNSNSPFPNAGTTIYTIFSIDDINLYMGFPSGIKEETQRPTGYQSVPYVKQ